MTVLGPGDPRAIQRKRPYYIIYLDDDGKEKEFTRFTVWTDFLHLKAWMKGQGMQIVKWGIHEKTLGNEAEEIIDDFFAFETAAKTGDEE